MTSVCKHLYFNKDAKGFVRHINYGGSIFIIGTFLFSLETTFDCTRCVSQGSQILFKVDFNVFQFRKPNILYHYISYQRPLITV